MIRISNIESGQQGGHWKCNIEHPKVSLIYNPSDARNKEKCWNLMRYYSYDIGGNILDIIENQLQ